MNTAGYDSKFATLYYPWIEVMDPLDEPADAGSAVGPRRRRLVPHRREPRRPQGAGQRGRHGRQRPRLPGHAGRAGRPQQGRHQLHPLVPGPRHPHLGRAHALERPGVALHQRPAALQLHRRVDHGGHAVVGVRAQRRAAVDAAADRGVELPHAHLARGRAVRRHARAGVLRQVRRGDQPARRDRGRPGHLRDRHRARQAGRVRGLPAQPVLAPARPRSSRPLPDERN